MVEVTATVEVRKDVQSLFPAVFRREPTRGAGKEEKSEEEDSTRNGLDTPGDTESSGALSRVLRATIVER